MANNREENPSKCEGVPSGTGTAPEGGGEALATWLWCNSRGITEEDAATAAGTVDSVKAQGEESSDEIQRCFIEAYKLQMQVEKEIEKIFSSPLALTLVPLRPGQSNQFKIKSPPTPGAQLLQYGAQTSAFANALYRIKTGRNPHDISDSAGDLGAVSNVLPWWGETIVNRMANDGVLDTLGKYTTGVTSPDTATGDAHKMDLYAQQIVVAAGILIKWAEATQSSRKTTAATFFARYDGGNEPTAAQIATYYSTDNPAGQPYKVGRLRGSTEGRGYFGVPTDPDQYISVMISSPHLTGTGTGALGTGAQNSAYYNAFTSAPTEADLNRYGTETTSTNTSAFRGAAQSLQRLANSWRDSLQCILIAYKAFEDAQAAATETLDDIASDYEGGLSRILPGGLPFMQDTGAIAALAGIAESVDTDLGSLLLGNKERLIFKEQCFLLSYINKISKHKKEYLESNLGRYADKLREKKMADQVAQARGVTGETQAARAAREGAANVARAESNLYAAQANALRGRAPSIPKILPYVRGNEHNASLLVDGDPYGFLNKLVTGENDHHMHNIPHYELSNLQPMIRLYKISYDRNGSEPIEREIPFESSIGSKADGNRIGTSEIEKLLSDRKKRGSGVGIKNFRFTYDGSNPFAVKKSIKAQLKIFANTFSDLLDDRGGYRYVDLALKTKGEGGSKCDDQQENNRTLEENQNLDKLNFRLKAVVGWARPKTLVKANSYLKDAIYDSYVTLNLTPTVHDFAFDDMGRVTFTINYLAYIEDFFDQRAYNIFANAEMTLDSGAKNITLLQMTRDLMMDYWSKKCDSTEMDNIRSNIADQLAEEKRSSILWLIQSLMNKRKIYYINMAYEEVSQFIRRGPWFDYEASGLGANFDIANNSQNNTALRAQVNTALEESDMSDNDENRGNFAASLFAADPNDYSLSFFYISDLIDIILENIGSELKTLADELAADTGTADPCQQDLKVHSLKRMHEQFKRLRILLGPLEVVNQVTLADSAFINLGDIPLSVKYFMEWITEKMLKKQESTYSLTQFLNDLFNEIVHGFLNNDSCFRYSIKQKVRINQSVITSYPPSDPEDPDAPPVDEITQQCEDEGPHIGRINIKRLSESEDIGSISSQYYAGQMARGPSRKPVLNISGPSGPAPSRSVGKEMNYFAYFVGRVQPLERMRGNKFDDERAGIHHYLLGVDRGLLKNIDIQKTNSQGLAEVRFEQDGYDGLKQLRVVYDATIDCYANVKAFPGTYIFIDPRGFDPSTTLSDDPLNLTQYGVGGYFMIIRSEHEFGPGIANSKLHAKWVAAIEPSPSSTSRYDESTVGGDYNRCSTPLAHREEEAQID